MHQFIPGEQKIFSSDVQLTISNLSFLIPHFQFSCFNFLVPTSLCSDIRYTWFDHVKLTFTWNIGYQCEYSKLSIYPFKKKIYRHHVTPDNYYTCGLNTGTIRCCSFSVTADNELVSQQFPYFTSATRAISVFKAIILPLQAEI